MKISSISHLKRHAAIAISGLLLAVGAGTSPAAADGYRKVISPRAQEAASMWSKPKAALAKKNRTKEAYLGRAPWICTPSGFGQTARCFQRAKY